MSLLFLLSASALLLTAAWNDIATRLIPDAISLWLLAIGALTRLFEGHPSDLAFSVGTALLLLSLLLTLYSRGLIGGGDVKIMTALAVGLSPLDCYRFIVATAIAGGLLGIIYLVLSRRLPPMHRVKGISLLSRVAILEPAWTAALRRGNRSRRHFCVASHWGLVDHAAPSRSSQPPLVHWTWSGPCRLFGNQAPNDREQRVRSRGASGTADD
jgi:prepilin peptidase CpaA